METLFNIPKESALWAWSILFFVALGTYAWRGLGVMLSGKIKQNSPLFGWITCVTYAMVAALVVRIIVLPVGVLSETAMAYRLLATGAALAIMIGKKNGLVPAISVGTLLMIMLGWLDPLNSL
ncbi:MAG: AzlD domain-containing protein [Betaproteobacteria bacterium]|jgi:branched-subunit amino acid transport protein|nr:AzlD domain-containing protein [Betaproteobacteria bacterium]